MVPSPARRLRLFRLLLLVQVVSTQAGWLAARRLCRRPPPPELLARRIGNSFERMGFTFLKLGQFLATRHDLISPALTHELTRFFERLPPLPFAVVESVVTQALGAPIRQLFGSFEPTPVAAATVAQVHRATLVDGTCVAVKVQRPGIEDVFEADVANLRMLARLLDRINLSGSLALVPIVDEFARFTRTEFDFLVEASTANRLRCEACGGVLIPQVIGDLTSRRVLTMTFTEGVSLARVLTLEAQGDRAAVRKLLPYFDRGLTLRNLSRASLGQFFDSGFFHGDPHPGNILVRPDNQIVLLDFGIFGELTPQGRTLLARYAENLALGDVAASFRHLSQIYSPGRKSDRIAFRREAIAALRRWYRASRDPASPASARQNSMIIARHLGSSFDAMVGVVRRHGYSTTMDYMLFWRAMIMLDAVALRLDPDFDLTRQMRRFFERRRGRACAFAPEAAVVTRWIDALPRAAGALSPRRRRSRFTLAGLETAAATRRRRRTIGRLAWAVASTGLLAVASAAPAGPSWPVAAAGALAALVGLTIGRGPRLGRART
jgi:ubiquinone biosynthesis protein